MEYSSDAFRTACDIQDGRQGLGRPKIKNRSSEKEIAIFLFKL